MLFPSLVKLVEEVVHLSLIRRSSPEITIIVNVVLIYPTSSPCHNRRRQSR